MEIVLDTTDKKINRRILGFKCSGYEHLCLLEDMLNYYNNYDIYNYNPMDLYEQGHLEAYECANSDCLFTIHLPSDNIDDAEDISENILDDAQEFLKYETRPKVVEQVLALARNSLYDYDRVELRYNSTTGEDVLDGFWTENGVECAERIRGYSWLTRGEIDEIKENIHHPP